MDQDDEPRPRPSCNCKKNNCVKRYCHCFDSHYFCSYACSCKNCWSREDRKGFAEEYAEKRLNTMPGASRSKGSAPTGEQRMHAKGCTCNKSGCKKNYCECFKKQVACTTRCKCQGCENSHGTGGRGLQESRNPNEAPDGGDGSPGTSNESAVVTDEELPENVAAIVGPRDLGTHIDELEWHSLPPEAGQLSLKKKRKLL